MLIAPLSEQKLVGLLEHHLFIFAFVSLISRTIIPKKFSHHCESYRLLNRVSNLGDLAKGLSIPRESDSEGRWGLITELPQDWGSRDSRRAQTKPCAHQDLERGAATPQETEPDFTGVAGRLQRGLGQRWPAAGAGTLTEASSKARYAGESP